MLLSLHVQRAISLLLHATQSGILVVLYGLQI